MDNQPDEQDRRPDQADGQADLVDGAAGDMTEAHQQAGPPEGGGHVAGGEAPVAHAGPRGHHRRHRPHPADEPARHDARGRVAPQQRRRAGQQRLGPAGGSPFGMDILRRLVEQAISSRTTTPRVPKLELTPREREVLSLVATGLSNVDIAKHLHVGVTTVKTHIANLMQKTDSPTRVHLAVLAVRHDLARG